jgi:REP element-mobilizing transposase RayT
LCGNDPYTKRNYDHRRQWLVDRIKKLASIFSINIAAYAIMSNHYHLVLQVDRVHADLLSMDEVIERWYQLYNGHPIVDEYLTNPDISPIKLAKVDEFSELWRKRLYDISWFMKCLNEHISREANKEDNCTGKFWEGRFKSQALLDEKALLSCMAYVDLNPIRAGIATSVEDSEFTSISERIKQYKSHQRQQKKPSADCHVPSQPHTLLPLSPIINNNAIPLSYGDYFELVDWSGRHIAPDKAGYIDDNIPPILGTLGIEVNDWKSAVKDFRRQYGSFAGSEMQLRDYAHRHGRSWCKGVG